MVYHPEDMPMRVELAVPRETINLVREYGEERFAALVERDLLESIREMFSREEPFVSKERLAGLFLGDAS